MFKNETLVKWFVCSLIVLPGWSQAQTPAAPTNSTTFNNPANCSTEVQLWGEAVKELARLKRTPGTLQDDITNQQETVDTFKKAKDDCNRRGSTTSGSCANADSEFNKAQGDFAGSCRGLPQTGGDVAGNIACGWNIARCDCRGLTPSHDRHSALKCSGFDATSGRFTPTSAGDKDTRQFPSCNAMAASDLEKYEKEVREAQKELRELERRLPEVNQGLAEAQSQKDEKVQQAKQQMVDARNKLEQARADALKERREAINNSAREVVQLRTQLTNMDDERTQLSLSRSDAELARQKGLAALKNNCHAQAVTDVNKRQTETLAMGRSYTRGGFNQMLRNTGVSSRQAWQQLALQFYNECMKSQPTRLATKEVNALYESVLAKANAKEKTFNERRKGLESQINEIVSGVCNPSGGTGVSETGTSTESRNCQAIRQFNENQSKADAEYQSQQRLNASAAMNAERSGAARVAAKAEEKGQIERNLAEERMRLSNLRNFLAAKQANAPGNIDAKDVGEIFNKHSALVGNAMNLVRCTAQDGKNCDGLCSTAFNYLRSIGHVPIKGVPWENSDPTQSGRPGTNGVPPLNKENWWHGEKLQ